MIHLENGKMSCGTWLKDTELYMNLVGPEQEEELLLRQFLPPSQHTFRQTC